MNKGKQLVLRIGLALLLLATVAVASTIKMSTASAQASVPTGQSSQTGLGPATNGGQNGAPSAGAGHSANGGTGAWPNEGVSTAESDHTLGQMVGHWMIGHGIGEWQNGNSPNSGAGFGPGRMMGGEGFFRGGE